MVYCPVCVKRVCVVDCVMSDRSEPVVLWTALVPPSLSPFRDRFRRLLNLLNCDVMITIMQLVLSRTTARWSKSWSEAQFEMVENVS